MQKKQRSYGQIISLILYCLAGVAIAKLNRDFTVDFVYMAVYAFGMRDPNTILIFYYAVTILLIYAATVFHVIVHEGGHLVAGLLSGYSFLSFRIFDLMWIKTDRGTEFKRMSLAGTAGQCLMSPPDLKDGKIPVLLYNFGGVISNLIFSALFLVLSLLPAVREMILLPMFLRMGIVMGITLALTNGIPMRSGPVSNDGKNALSLGKDREAMRAFWIQLKSNEETAKGVRIKDMPAEWFEVPSDEAMKNDIVAVLGVLAASRLGDERRFEEEKALTEHLLSLDSGIAGIHRALLTCDLIYIELTGENRADEIEKLLTKEQKRMMKAMKTSIAVLRTEYALSLLHEKDEKKAEKCEKRFEKVSRRYPYPVEISGERELMDTAKRKYAETKEDLHAGPQI